MNYTPNFISRLLSAWKCGLLTVGIFGLAFILSDPIVPWQQSSGGASSAEAQSAWQVEWEKTLKEAKKEGRVTVYHYGTENRFLPFQKKYPGIKLVLVSSNAGPRITAERRAGKYLVDVYSGGATTPYRFLYRRKALDPLPPALILPEVVDRSKWFEGRYRWVDPERKYIFINEGTDQPLISRNTNIVKEGEIRSYRDLLNPKWKGKILMADPKERRVTSFGLRFFYYHPELGPEFIRRLFGEMKVTYSRDRRQMVDWLGTGRFPLALFVSGVAEARGKGLPVDLITSKWLKEGGVIKPTGVGSIALMNRAPHPNSAKVLINWHLSREGQIAMQKSMVVRGGADSLRVDIPKDDVAMEVRRRKGEKYTSLDDRPETLDDKHIYDIVGKARSKAGQR